MRRRLPSSLASTASIAAVATLGGLALGAWLGESPTLAASYQGSLIDSDGDGLADQAEVVNFTNPDAADSDADGFSDLEELARGLDPLGGDSGSQPEELAIGLAATSDGEWVRTDVAFYLPDGSYQGLAFDFGAFAEIQGADGPERLQVPFPTALTLGNGSLAAMPGRAPGSLVIHFDVVLPHAVFESLGWLPLYATIGPAEVGVTAAAAQTLVHEGGALMSIEALEPADLQGFVAFSTASQVGGVVSRPIEPEGNLPSSMTPNQICSQTVSEVGGGGGLVELQVDDSVCVDADFLFCSSNCAAQTGSSRTIVDPLALIGG